MNENEVIEILIDYLKINYPKKCKKCNTTFDSIADYLSKTDHSGNPVSYDAIKGNWSLLKQRYGTISMANCNCGSTLSVSSKNMDLKTARILMKWARKESKRRNIKVNILLSDLRSKIDGQILLEEKQS